MVDVPLHFEVKEEAALEAKNIKDPTRGEASANEKKYAIG